MPLRDGRAVLRLLALISFAWVNDFFLPNQVIPYLFKIISPLCRLMKFWTRYLYSRGPSNSNSKHSHSPPHDSKWLGSPFFSYSLYFFFLWLQLDQSLEILMWPSKSQAFITPFFLQKILVNILIIFINHLIYLLSKPEIGLYFILYKFFLIFAHFSSFFCNASYFFRIRYSFFQFYSFLTHLISFISVSFP